MAKADLSAERLRELLHYDPETGIFTWKVRKKSAKPGQIAASKVSNGYVRVKIDQVGYMCHRLAWFYVHGKWPEIIDHINGRPDDNRIVNLRNGTHELNMQNKRGPMRNNRSGYMGVRFAANGWRASLGHRGKMLHLGRFKTAEEAHQAYLDAKRRLHEGCTI